MNTTYTAPQLPHTEPRPAARDRRRRSARLERDARRTRLIEWGLGLAVPLVFTAWYVAAPHLDPCAPQQHWSRCR